MLKHPTWRIEERIAQLNTPGTTSRATDAQEAEWIL